MAEEEACTDCQPMPCIVGKVRSVWDTRFSVGVGQLSAQETRFFFFCAFVACAVLEMVLTDDELGDPVSRRRAASNPFPSIGDTGERVGLGVTVL